jgi:hypothetical protein
MHYKVLCIILNSLDLLKLIAMNAYLKTQKPLEWTLLTFRFIKNNFWVIFSLGLIAAVGRTIQLRAFGPITPATHILLEILVESARLAIILYALGLANIKSGLSKIVRLVINRSARRQNWQVATTKLSQQWLAILINLGAFLLMAYLNNLLIDHIAYETCLYIALTTRQLISEESSVWALILFFKNISVIPFTLVFQTLFILWITNRLPPQNAV